MGSTPFIRNAVSSSSHPITVAEFADALFQRWGHQGHAPSTLGLAISGGVDSMALAALCARLQDLSHQSLHSRRKEKPPELCSLHPLKFRAFIVDHDLRPGSSQEAEAVSKVLKERNIEARILKIKWPGQGTPSHSSNFESLARKHRFRLLGKACSDLGINSLLLAHHEDDQAETMIMRLANGQGVKGLLGIKTRAGMPECYGIHGVHESGGYHSKRDVHQRKRISKSMAFSSRPGTHMDNQLPIEAGGIQVYRPLLSFSKARLVATCFAEEMEWFEDQTNKDPTITMRNAIRHMYNHHSMPAALTKPALLALSTRLNDKAARQTDIMKSWLKKCRITHFETRAGTARVLFGDLDQFRVSRSLLAPGPAGQIAAELLRQIILLVTPQEHVDLTSLHGAVQRIFPELYQQVEQPLPKAAFTASGVYFQPVQRSEPESQSPSSLIPEANHGQKCEWFVSRQPYILASLPKLQIDIPQMGGSWSPWYLYDGRYWIRIQNPSTASLLVEPFKREQMAGFRASLTKADGVRFRKLLREKAPDHVRWTLPAIARREKGGGKTVIALPSLDLSVNGLRSLVRWEIRYKKIYTADLPMDDSLLESSR